MQSSLTLETSTSAFTRPLLCGRGLFSLYGKSPFFCIVEVCLLYIIKIAKDKKSKHNSR